MKFCPNCGSQVEDNAKVCPNCGKELNIVVERKELDAAPAKQKDNNKALATAAKVLMLISVILVGLSCIFCLVAGLFVRSHAEEINKQIHESEKYNQIYSIIFDESDEIEYGQEAQAVASMLITNVFSLLVSFALSTTFTVIVWKKLKNNQKIGTGIKICVLLFCSLVAGILLLFIKDDEQNAPIQTSTNNQ